MFSKLFKVLIASLLGGILFIGSVSAAPETWFRVTSYNNWFTATDLIFTSEAAAGAYGCNQHTLYTGNQTFTYSHRVANEYYCDWSYNGDNQTFIIGAMYDSTYDCGAGSAFDPDTQQCEVSQDCSTETQTYYVSYQIAATSIDIGGCGYSLGAKVCGIDTFCYGSITGTGNLADPLGFAANNPIGETATPITEEFPTENTSDWDTSVTNIDNGDGTNTDTVTDVENSSNNINDKVTFQGDSVTVQNSDGTQTTTTTTTVIVNNADGSTTETSNSTSQTSTGGGTTTTTNINTGAVTTNVTNPTIINSGTTGTRTTDINGDVTSQSNTSTGTEVLEPTDPNDPSAVPSPDGYVNGDYTSLDDAISSFKTVPNVSSENKPTLSFVLNSGGLCTGSNYSFNFWGAVVTLEICDYVAIVQSVLYWLFYVFTAFYAYSTLTSLGVKRS